MIVYLLPGQTMRAKNVAGYWEQDVATQCGPLVLYSKQVIFTQFEIKCCAVYS